MLKGYRFRPNDIYKYENAMWQQSVDDRVEVMMLFFAEALHDVAGYGSKRTSRILHSVDERMKEFTDGVNAGTFDLDALRIRVFAKSKFMFALSVEDQEHITKILEEAGYNVNEE